MKPTFSISEALAAPFNLLKRKPLSLFVWGVLMTASFVAVYSLMIPLFAALPVGPGDGEAAMEAYVQKSQQMSLGINALMPLLYLIMLLVWTAAARATLSPGRGDAFAFLRIGMDEVRVAVVYVAWFVGWYAILVIAALIGMAICAALWFASHAAAIISGCLYGLALVVGATWLFLRLSLIAPVSFILKDFAFVQGWALSKGQVLNLLGLNLLKWLISIVMSLALYLVVGAILVAGYFGQGLSWPSPVETVADLAPLARSMLIPGAVALIPFVLFYGWAIALTSAPAIVAARQLLDGAPVRPTQPVADLPPIVSTPAVEVAEPEPEHEPEPEAVVASDAVPNPSDPSPEMAATEEDVASPASSSPEAASDKDSDPADPLHKS